jgi:cyclophilin family peptidyl-prolyl cis-trans isomerase
MPSKAAKNPFGTTLSVQSSAATKVASLGSALGSALGTAPAAQPKGANIGTEDYRIRLIKFYQTHNASKIGTVDATLKKYKGKEDELFRKLETKYAAPQPTAPQFPSPAGTGPRCYLEFSIGNEQPARRVVVKLYRDKAPLAAENFRCLCTGEITTHRAAGKPLRYLGSKVHRIVPGFCLQAGDFTTGNGRGGASIYPPNSEHGDSWGKFRDEPTGFLNHSKKGLLSMANSGKNTNSSQFFFTLKPVPYLNGKHVVFGEIEEGMDALEELGKVTTDSRTSRPIDDVVISSCGEIDASGNDCPSLGMGDETESSSSGLVPAPFGVAIGGAPLFGRSSSAFGSNGGKGSRIFDRTPAFLLGHSSSSATSAYGSTSTHASAAVRSPSVLGSSSSSSNYTTSANISNVRVGAGLSTSGSTIAAPVLFGSSSTLTNNKAVPVHSAPVFGSPSTLGIGGGTQSVPGFSGSSNSKSTSGFWTLTTAGSPGGAEPVFGKLSSFGVDGTRSSNTSRKSAGGGFGALSASASTSPPAVFGRPSAPKPSAFGSRSGNSETATSSSPSRNNFSFGD